MGAKFGFLRRLLREPRQRWLAGAGILLAALVSGCAPIQYWDEYASKTVVMTFVTFVPCDAEVRETPAHQAYYHAWNVERFPSRPGSYWVAYHVSKDKFENGVVYFSYVRYVGLQHYSALTVAKPPPYTREAKCAVAVVLPWSEHVARPFYIVAAPSDVRAEVQGKLSQAAVAGLVAVAVVFIGWLVAINGFLEGEAERFAVCSAWLVSLIPLNGMAWWAFLWTAWDGLQGTLAYYAFYDAVPRSTGLLPLSWSQAQTLFAGPPYPPVTWTGESVGFYAVLTISCASWVCRYAARVFKGVVYLLMPDPFATVRGQAAAEGRAMTPEEYMRAITEAASRMSTWELELFKRKIKQELPHG